MRSLLTAVVLSILCTFEIDASPNRDKYHRAGERVPDSYLVVLKDDIDEPVDLVLDDLRKAYRARLVHTYRHTIYGAAFSMSESTALAMAGDARVKGVWEDDVVQLATVQTNPHWQLDRIDDRVTQRLDGSYEYCGTGAGVRVYVIDTGVWKDHSEFSNADPISGGPRVVMGFDYEPVLYPTYPNRSNDPCGSWKDPAQMGGSHGTAVASVLGGKTMGVAKDVVIVPVRTFACSGRSWGVTAQVAGIDWIAADPGYEPLLDPADPQSARWGRVVNISWVNTTGELGVEHPVEAALRRLPSDISIVAAAGNQNTAIGSQYLPARMPDILVAGGSKGHLASCGPSDPTSYCTDGRWNDGPTDNPGSNYGPTIDLFAPADRMLVAHWSSPTATRDPNDTRYASGTSFAAPLVAGVVARLRQGWPTETREMMESRIKSIATTEAHGLNLANRMDSPNRLLYHWDCRRRAL